jgi:hypothetical protein
MDMTSVSSIVLIRRTAYREDRDPQVADRSACQLHR